MNSQISSQTIFPMTFELQRNFDKCIKTSSVFLLCNYFFGCTGIPGAFHWKGYSVLIHFLFDLVKERNQNTWISSKENDEV